MGIRSGNKLRRWLLLLAVIPIFSYSQTYINLSKAEVRKRIEITLNTIRYEVQETDTSLHFMVRDPALSTADFIYTFDEAGKCFLEETIAGCDSCYIKYLNTALRNKKYKWSRLNDRLYISSFSKRMLLEIPAYEKQPSFFIRRMNWTRQTYKTLLTSR